MPNPIFHVAVAVDDIKKARQFYVNTLGCKERRDTSTKNYAVIDFWGAQLVVIEAPKAVEKSKDNPKVEPYKHFGWILDWDEWHDLKKRLVAKKVKFRVKPNIKKHKGIGEVGNMFLKDPAGNFVEFKSYRDKSKVL